MRRNKAGVRVTVLKPKAPPAVDTVYTLTDVLSFNQKYCIQDCSFSVYMKSASPTHCTNNTHLYTKLCIHDTKDCVRPLSNCV